MKKGKIMLKKGLSVLLSVAIVLGMMGSWSVLAALPIVPDKEINVSLQSDQKVVKSGDTLTVNVYISANEECNFQGGSAYIEFDTAQLTSSGFSPQLEGVTGGTYSSSRPDRSCIMMSTKNTSLPYYHLTTEPTLFCSFTYTVSENASGEIDFNIYSPGESETNEDGEAIGHIDSDFYMMDDEGVATYYNTNFADNTDVSIQTPVTGLTIQNNGQDVSEMNLELNATEKTTLTANKTPENATVPITWSSSNTDVLMVDPTTGELTPVTTGDAVITATADNQGLATNATASCTVHVVKSLNSISLDTTETELEKNKTTELTVSYAPSDTTDNKDVTWNVIEGGDVVSVKAKEGSTNNSVGVVTGLKEGKAKVQAQVGTHTAVCNVTVTEKPLTFISLDKSEASFAWNDNNGVDLSVTYDPEDTTDDQTIVWSVSNDNEGALIVEPSGEHNRQAKITASKPVTDAEVIATVKGTEISASCTINVTKANLDPVTFPSGATMTYGQTLADVTFTDAGDTTQGSFAFANPAEKPTAVGTPEYEMIFTPTQSDLYKEQTKTVSVTVNKKAITVTADNQEMVYKEDLPTFTYIIPEGALVEGDTQDALALTLHAVDADGREMTKDTVQGGKKYDIIEKECNSTNYDVTVTKGTLTVKQAEPEVDFPDGATLTYGKTLEEATLTGNYSTDGTWEFIEPTAKPHVSDSQTTPYGIKFTPTSANYQSVTGSITVTVAPKAITVQADDATRSYGVENPGFTYSDVNAVIETGDDLQLTLKAVVTGTEEEVTAQSPAGGSYSIEKNACSNQDYDVTVTPGTLTITAATPTVTFPTGASITYGQKLSEATIEGGSATFNEENVPGKFVFINPDQYLAVPQSGNPCNIQFVPTDENNFATVTVNGTAPATVPVTVTPANVTVTPTNTSKDYLAPVPNSYAYTAEGMVCNEEPSVLKATFAAYESYTSPEVNTPVTAQTDAGAYRIIAIGYNNPNYTVTFNEGTLTINQIAPTVTFPTNVEVVDGSALSTATYTEGTSNIEGTFAFNEPEKVLALGEDGNYPMTFTPSEENQKNYTSVTQNVSVKVVPAFSIDSVKIAPSGATNYRPKSTRLLVMKGSYQDFTATVSGNNVTDSRVDWSIVPSDSGKEYAADTKLQETTNDEGQPVERLTVASDETNTTITLKATSVLSDDYFATIKVNITARGDFDNSSRLGVADYDLLQSAIGDEIATNEYNQFYDLDNSGDVTAGDLLVWLELFAAQE